MHIIRINRFLEYTDECIEWYIVKERLDKVRFPRIDTTYK